MHKNSIKQTLDLNIQTVAIKIPLKKPYWTGTKIGFVFAEQIWN